MTAKAGSLSTWQWRNPLPEANTLSGVTYGNGLYVAVGEAGAILASVDGVNWTNQNTGTENLDGVDYANGLFLALGGSGTILTSTNATNWTPQKSGTGVTLYNATYGNGMYVVVGGSGTILSSTDSINWTPQSSTVATNLYDVTFAQGFFIAVGDAGVILYSTDGATWSQVSGGSGTANPLTSVTSGLNDFVAVGPQGDVVSSPDGLDSWEEDGPFPGTNLTSIVFGNNEFVALGSGNTVVTSTDGASFATGSGGPSGLPNGITYGNGQFVAVGTDTADSFGNIAVSADGNTWTAASSGVTYENLNAVGYTGQKFVGVGVNGTLLTSPDGANWSSGTSGQSTSLNAVASGPTVTIVAGNGVIISSTDTVSWSADSLPVTANFNGAVYGSGMYVTVGNGGTILTSTDGLSWANPTSNTVANLEGVAYGKGLYVAVGAGGAAVSSTDGATWAPATKPATVSLSGVAFQNGIFVATGPGGDLFTSPDGKTWTAGVSGVTTNLNGITAGNGYFLAVGNSGTLLSSTDGNVWAVQDPYIAGATTLTGVAYGYGVFVAVGTTGAILESQPQPGVGPIVTTGTVSGIISTSAVLNGQVDPNGAGANAYFAYSTNSQLVGATTTSGTLIAVGAGAVSVSSTVTGLLPGTTYYYAAVGSNANAEEYGQILSFETAPQAPVITSANVASGTNGEPFTYQITASYNPTSYGATGLPPGLTVTATTGLISGTPTQFGNFPVTLSAANTGGTGTETLELRIIEPALPQVTGQLQIDGTVGAAISPYQINASNGPTSYGATGLPPGLMLTASTGIISGTPTQAGQSNVTISGSNARGVGSATLVISITPLPPVITSSTTPMATEGETYFYQIEATNYPSSYSVTGLPTGLSYDTKTGAIFGTPTESGTFPLTATATNAGGGNPTTIQLTVVVPPEPVITSSTTITGTAGVQFQYQIVATNDPTSYSASNFPPGLVYNASTGLISGVPSASGTYNTATISAGNDGGTATAPATVVILPPLPVINSAPVATASNGQAFSYQISASNNATTYGASGLPPGLTVAPSTGLISGTPSGYGTVPVTISAANTSGTSYKNIAVNFDINLSQVAGTYDGLATVSGTNVGLVNLTLSAKGTYTGKLTLAGITYTLKGPITQYGALTGYAEEGGSTIVLAITADPFVPSLSGTIAARTGSVVTNYGITMAEDGVFKAGTLPGTLISRYTVVLPGLSGTDVRTPHAPGYATMNVTSKGAITLVGKLGDGTPVSISAMLHADQKTFTLFEALYAGKRPGTIAGEVTFESETDTDADGSLDWIKPLQLKPGYYPGGFARSVEFMGAKYSSTATPITSGTITIGGGDIAAGKTITNAITVSTSGKIMATGTNDVAGAISLSTGGFSGSFEFPVTGKKTTYGGVIYQKPAPSGGFGLFLGPTQSGGVEIDQ